VQFHQLPDDIEQLQLVASRCGVGNSGAEHGRLCCVHAQLPHDCVSASLPLPWCQRAHSLARYTYVTNVANVGNSGYITDVLNVDLVVDPYSSEPLYAQVAAGLRARIESGELARLDPLPSEKTIQQEYGVSRDTARRAIELLRSDGLVFTIPQRGTYVGPRP